MKRFWLLRNPEKIWTKVEKDFKNAPNPEHLYSMQFANLSKEKYSELKEIAKKNGITVHIAWSTPDYQAYSFKK